MDLDFRWLELAKTTDEKENKTTENNILRRDIIKLCNRDDRKEKERILLLGSHGAGKSCIVKTVISALVGKRVKPDKGIAVSKTLQLIRLKNCGITSDDLRDSKYSRFLQTAYGKLPTLVDVEGLDNVNTPALREILQHILGGYIPSGTSITHLMNVQDTYGVGNLDLIYNKCYERWKITKVVFVVSAAESVPPRKLIECLHSVLAGDSTRSIFVVITRYDRVVNDARDVSDEMQDEQVSNVVDVGVTMKHLEKLEMELANIFSIEGSRDQNMMRWTNYVDDVGYESNPNIDNIALKLLKFMVTPGSPQQDRRPINITLLKRLKIKINNANGAHIQSWHLILAVLVVVVLVVVYKTLSMNV